MQRAVIRGGEVPGFGVRRSVKNGGTGLAFARCHSLLPSCSRFRLNLETSTEFEQDLFEGGLFLLELARLLRPVGTDVRK
jgi:hypothetical protein